PTRRSRTKAIRSRPATAMPRAAPRPPRNRGGRAAAAAPRQIPIRPAREFLRPRLSGCASPVAERWLAAGFRSSRRAVPGRQASEQIGASARLRFEAQGEAALESRGAGGVAVDRVRQRGREQRRLARIELACALVEIAMRRGLDPVEPVAPFGDVEID